MSFCEDSPNAISAALDNLEAVFRSMSVADLKRLAASQGMDPSHFVEKDDLVLALLGCSGSGGVGEDDDAFGASAPFGGGGSSAPAPQPPSIICASPTRLQAFADVLSAARNVIVVMGAGASTSAGIPDFRTPGTGLYSNLQAYGLPEPEAVFSVDFFRSNPVPFNILIRDLLPGAHKPTPTHAFLRMLHDSNKLLRIYTQNVDGLESLAGVPDDRVVQCHGGFRSAHCIDCDKSHSMQLVRDCCKLNANIQPDGSGSAGGSGPVIPTCDCGGLVKPQITFFGEALPKAFWCTLQGDLEACDCMIVVGTSLKVMPVSRLPCAVSSDVPRIVINRDPVGEENGMFTRPGDAFMQGSCDDGVRALCDLAGLARQLAHAECSVEAGFNACALPSAAALAHTTQRVSFSMQVYSLHPDGSVSTS